MAFIALNPRLIDFTFDTTDRGELLIWAFIVKEMVCVFQFVHCMDLDHFTGVFIEKIHEPVTRWQQLNVSIQRSLDHVCLIDKNMSSRRRQNKKSKLIFCVILRCNYVHCAKTMSCKYVCTKKRMRLLQWAYFMTVLILCKIVVTSLFAYTEDFSTETDLQSLVQKLDWSQWNNFILLSVFLTATFKGALPTSD